MASTELSRDGSKKVREVCQDFMTREDEALAQKLQDEEFQTHYIRNRQERGTARVDVKAAKNAYLEEVKQAGLLREYEYQRLAADDAWMASELQHRLDEEESLETQQRAASEMQDEEYAQFLQEREKEKMKRERQQRLRNRIERERRELDKIERESHQGRGSEEASNAEYGFPHSGSSRKEPAVKEMPKDTHGPRVSMEKDDENWNDLRSYEAGDFPNAEEERDRQQELEDEELARRLQRREEEKLKKLMEERDRKLALKMQRKETEEYRRERAERQSRKTLKNQNTEASSNEDRAKRIEDQEHERSTKERVPSIERHKQTSKQSDEPYHYYEQPVYGREIATSQHSESKSARQDEGSMERRPKSNSITSRTRGDIPVYEFVEPEIPSNARTDTPQKAAHRDDRTERLPEKVENEQSKSRGSPSQRVANNSHSQHEKSHDPRLGNQRFTNVAASIDPTFKGEVEEPLATPEDRIWAIGDSGIKVSSSSKPAPLVQNTKRKQSRDKSGKDKEKCKQQ